MSKRLLDYDPLTGIKTFHHYDSTTNQTHIEQTQDVQKILDYTKSKANDSSYKRRGIKSDWYHFARVPNTVILELKNKYNLDVFDKHDLPKVEKVLQRDYPKLLTVDRI